MSANPWTAGRPGAAITKVYVRAAMATGKSVDELRRMAEHVFASILHHCLEEENQAIWTISSISKPNRPEHRHKIWCEVNFPPRFPKVNDYAVERFREVFKPIAAEVPGHEHGKFLTLFAEAFVHADEENVYLLLTAAVALAAKYGLMEQGEGAKA
jgi:hypothetical protein